MGKMYRVAQRGAIREPLPVPSLTFGWATISQSMAVLPALPVLEKNAAPVRSFGGDLLMFG